MSAPASHTYRTSRGRLFSFTGWTPGETPLELFDRGEWLQCLHACMFASSRSAIEDDGVLHELVHLALGIEICTHNSMAMLRSDVAAIDLVSHETRPIYRVHMARAYDQRVKAILAFNTCQDDLDGKLEAAWLATLKGAKTSAAPAPPGYVMVPVEPTGEMLEAAKKRFSWSSFIAASRHGQSVMLYRAMLSASPQPAPTQEIGK